jgi:protein-S-isoprenylcysteine O-methyltransferase Ste14
MDASTTALMRQTWLRQVISLAVFAALLFMPAGSLRFWQAWIFGLVFVAASSAIGIYFLKHDPALVERRMTVGPGAEPETAQKIIISAVIIGFCLLIALPGFDHRWHWSEVPSWLVFVANAGVALSFVIFFAVMKQNSYAASTVRVEADQPVISTGLYSIVRHPMYAGATLLLLCIPLALGSYWSLPLLILLFPVLAWRLLDEERVLKRDLPGYADYCRRTRYRLIPMIW